MKENLKIEKELLFKNNIKDITSISLDNDYKINKQQITGNFIINGEYKIHEISINKEKFNFKIPYSYDINNDIDTSTVKVDITNFTYDYKKDELLVNIEYKITGDRKDVLLFDDEESLDDFLKRNEVEVISDRIDNIKKEIDEENNNEPKKDNEEKKVLETKKDNDEKKVLETKKDNDEKKVLETKKDEIRVNTDTENETVTEKDIINNINNVQDKFITYKVYKLKETDTLESIVMKYHTTIDELKEYNDLSNIKINDKIIIPKYE